MLPWAELSRMIRREAIGMGADLLRSADGIQWIVRLSSALQGFETVMTAAVRTYKLVWGHDCQ